MWNYLLNNLSNPFLWEDGRFMQWFCLIISIIIVVIVVIITNLFRQHRWVLLMPIALAIAGIIIGIVSVIFTNSVLQTTYLGIAAYSFWFLVFIGGMEAVLMCIFRMMRKM